MKIYIFYGIYAGWIVELVTFTTSSSYISYSPWLSE